MSPERWASALAGVVVLVVTFSSILRILVVPRGHNSRLMTALWLLLRTLLRTIAGPSGRYERRDHLLAWLAPLVLVGTLGCWIAAMYAGFGLLMHAVSGLGWRPSLREAGSSLFTLGYASTTRLHLSVVDFVAAATGPVVIALQIAYLPSLYAAYNRRETDVTLLQSRAGEPAWGPELLARQALVGTTGQLRELYRLWERLAADVGESHTNYPILLAFRSPRPYRNWVVGLLAVLDAAALHLSLCPSGAPPEARLALRAGFTALRDIARVVHIPFEPDPHPDAPVHLTYQEFLAGAAWAVEAGFPAERDAAAAWPDFRGWRVNYETVVYALARRGDAVPAPWSGPRDWTCEPMTPVRPPHREPGAPDVIYPGDSARRGPAAR